MTLIDRQYKRWRSAWTLLEVLVVLSIVAMLGALSLNGVQAARESARQLHCLNNLRQIGLATNQFEAARGHYPTGGWGWSWVADSETHPKYGQPGGWIYQLLPYLEASSIHDLPNVGGDRTAVEAKIHELLATPCVTFHCPSRGNQKVIPFNSERIPKIANLREPPKTVALTDYVGNSGTQTIFYRGPAGRTIAEIEAYTWRRLPETDGMMLYQNRIRPADVTAGLSNVLWVGEKYVGFENYVIDHVGGNDQSLYSGETSDIRRHAVHGILPDWFSVIGEEKVNTKFAFGTPHIMSMNAVFVDGSTQKLDVNTDLLVFRRLVCRRPPLW